MARVISQAEGYEKVYQAFQTVNFSAYDFNAIKQSILDYIKLYFAEDFNDYIESSEFIAIVEAFAYVGELLAYRQDVNAHENFISVAQRKESVLRLAKLVSYKASRNIPNRGLVKITSIKTTETILDGTGVDLTNKTIFWNDVNNANWKDQFLLVINKILEQDFGTVSPNERVQVDDVVFEVYPLDINPIQPKNKSVLKYNVSVQGANYDMELVPVTLTSGVPVEKRPEIEGKFSILYANDGLGDSSNTTGFMLFTKQGSLNFVTQTFDGITPNQTFDIKINNINDVDLWVNNVDSSTLAIIDTSVTTSGRTGEWVPVDISNAQNIIFNTNVLRNKYEVETLANDQVRIIFGDGEYADIPSGTFHFWYRTSANANLVIPKNAVVNKSASFTYQDINNNTQTFTFTYSLISTLQNASASEDIEHIRRLAPAVYYTQDRMVNARDYNTFMLQDPTIIKLRAINRTFAGDSKYITWFDPSESYENVKIFGTDLALYYKDLDPLNGALVSVTSAVSVASLISNYIEPLLGSLDFYSILAPMYSANNIATPIRRLFDVTQEYNPIFTALSAPSVTTVDIYFDLNSGNIPQWNVTNTGLHMIRVEAVYTSSILTGWKVYRRTNRLDAQSMTTRFWNTNSGDRVIDYDTLDTTTDYLNVLQANATATNGALLTTDYTLPILGLEVKDIGTTGAGITDIHRLSVSTPDTNQDSIPDGYDLTPLIDSVIQKLVSGVPVFPIITPPFITALASQDIEVSVLPWDSFDGVHVVLTYGTNWTETSTVNTVTNSIDILNGTFTYNDSGSTTNTRSITPPDLIFVRVYSWVYLFRETIDDAWIPVGSNLPTGISLALPYGNAFSMSNVVLDGFLSENNNSIPFSEKHYVRFRGRYPLNFMWAHFSPQYHLVDPAATNIIDIFVITQGYLQDTQRYIDGKTTTPPTLPSPVDLKITYAELLDNKMISDTVIMHPGKFKYLFGSKSIAELQAIFRVVRGTGTSLTDNEVKNSIKSLIQTFFDVNLWEFGETFFFTELAAYIHNSLGEEIDSIIIVPLLSGNQFGDLFEVTCADDEIFYADIGVEDIEIVSAFSATNMRQVPST